MEQYGGCWPMLLLYSLSAWGLKGRLCQSHARGFAHSSFSSCSSSMSAYMSTSREMEFRKCGDVAAVEKCWKNTCIPSSLCTSLTRGWWRGSLHSSACCCFFTMDLQYDCSSATCWGGGYRNINVQLFFCTHTVCGVCSTTHFTYLQCILTVWLSISKKETLYRPSACSWRRPAPFCSVWWFVFGSERKNSDTWAQPQAFPLLPEVQQVWIFQALLHFPAAPVEYTVGAHLAPQWLERAYYSLTAPHRPGRATWTVPAGVLQQGWACWGAGEAGAPWRSCAPEAACAAAAFSPVCSSAPAGRLWGWASGGRAGWLRPSYGQAECWCPSTSAQLKPRGVHFCAGTEKRWLEPEFWRNVEGGPLRRDFAWSFGEMDPTTSAWSVWPPTSADLSKKLNETVFCVIIATFASQQDQYRKSQVRIPLFLLTSCDRVRGGIRFSLGRFPYGFSSSSFLEMTSAGTSRHTRCLLVSILCVELRAQTGTLTPLSFLHNCSSNLLFTDRRTYPFLSPSTAQPSVKLPLLAASPKDSPRNSLASGVGREWLMGTTSCPASQLS